MLWDTPTIKKGKVLRWLLLQSPGEVPGLERQAASAGFPIYCTMLKDYYLSWTESKMLLRILPLHILHPVRILSEGRVETLEEYSYKGGSKDVGWQIKGTE